MRAGTIFQIGILSFAIALSSRVLSVWLTTSARRQVAQDACSLVSNYLETNDVREAFEGMERAIAASSQPGACVSVIDSGRSYSPDCVDPAKSYQDIVCKVNGNVGIRAEVHYVSLPIVTPEMGILWLELWTGLAGLVLVLRWSLASVVREVTDELQHRIFSESTSERPGLLRRWTRIFAEKIGILRGIRAQTKRFESRISEFETKIRSEVALRTKQETEASKSREYIEKVREIQHDMRSPLSSLLSAQGHLSGDEEAQGALTSGIRGIQRMLDELSEVENEAQAPQLTIAELIVEETAMLVRSKFLTSKQLKLNVVYDGACLSAVSVVPGGLARVLENLLENAFDASSPGGEITLRVKSNQGICRIAVEDHGCGVSAEAIPRLFEKGATFGKVNGTGRGLYQCKRNVESWNGNINYEPLNPGSRFSIYLPLLQTGVPFVGLPQAQNLIVIDDDPSTAESLASGGFQIRGLALSVDAGRKLLSQPRLEDTIILVDQRLDQGKLGTDLIASQRDRRGIILCTNDFDNPETLRLARQIGVGILPKPLCFYAMAGQLRASAPASTPASSSV